jgi:hypothetical protein
MRHTRPICATWVLVLALCLQVTALAEQPWPGHAAEAALTSVKTDSLPEELQGALLRLDEFSQGRNTLSDSLHVARIDLNGDRVDEFIVQSAETYSGGPMIYAFERRGGACAEIVECQGVIYFAPRVYGYFEIVSQSRGGGGNYLRELLRYERDRYQIVRAADYHHDDGGPWERVRERNPRTLQ